MFRTLHRLAKAGGFLAALILVASPVAAQLCPDFAGQPRLLGADTGFNHLAAAPVAPDLVVAVTQDSILVVYRQQMDAEPVPVASVYLPGDYRALAALDRYVYVSGDRGVKIFRVDADGSLVFRGRLTGFEPAGPIKADGDRLAMIHEGAWSLWDCRDRELPVRTARVDFETNSYSFHYSRIAVGGDRVAVDLTVYDISDPAAPVVTGVVPQGESSLAGCEIAGDRLYQLRTYVASGGSYIYGDRWFYRTFNLEVRDLADPVEFGVLARHAFATSGAWPLNAPRTVLARNGDRVIAGQTHDPNILVLDTYAPVDEVPLWIPVFPEPALALQGDHLLGLGPGVWSCAVPSTSEPGRVPVSGAGTGGSGWGPGYVHYGATDIVTYGDLVAVSEWVDESDGDHYWRNWVTVRLYRPGTNGRDPVADLEIFHSQLALIDGYLLSGGSDLHATDISDPTAPGEAVPVPGIEDMVDLVALDGRTIAVGDRQNGISVYYVTRPLTPVLLGACALGETAGLMRLDGDVVLVTIPRKDVIKAVDVSDRTRPRILEVIKFEGRVTDLAGAGGHGVALGYDSGFNYQLDFDYGPATVSDAAGPDAFSLPKPVVVTPRHLSATRVTDHGQTLVMSGGGVHSYETATRSFIGGVATSHPVLGAVSCEEMLYAVCFGELFDLTDTFCNKPRDGAPGGVAAAESIPRTLAFEAAPNPFNPMTRLSFTLTRAQPVALTVYDLKGRRVRELARGVWTADRHTVDWNGRDDGGREVSSGTYFVRLDAGAESAVLKATLVR